jgi:hypothetical protein
VHIAAEPQDKVSELLRTALAAVPEDLLMFRGKRREVVRTELAHVGPRRLLDKTRTLEQEGVGDGDALVLYVETVALIDYSLLPAGDPIWLFQTLQLAISRPAHLPNPALWGVLLYTDADAEVATYVRTNFDELNALSGPVLRIFVIERPDDWGRARRYWRRHLDPDLYRIFGSLRWLTWRPHDRQDAYDIARTLGVDVARLPCLVLFRDVAAHPKLIFPITTASPEFFRRLFGAIQSAIGQGPAPYSLSAEFDASRGRPSQERIQRFLTDQGIWPSDGTAAGAGAAGAAIGELSALPVSSPGLSGEFFYRVLAAEKRILAELQPAAPAPAPGAPGGGPGDDRYTLHGCTVILTSKAEPVTESFNFYGQTTFINRPVDTVVSEFQNTYTAATGRDELSELLRLVLGSPNLADADKQGAAQLINEIATQAAGPTPDSGNIRKKLESLTAIVARAADVTQPALEIISAILRLIAH